MFVLGFSGNIGGILGVYKNALHCAPQGVSYFILAETLELNSLGFQLFRVSAGGGIMY